MEISTWLDLNSVQWSLIMMSGMLIGMTKVGIPGVSIIAVSALAYVFGGKSSTGILLPILILADLFGVGYYRRHAQWRYLIKFFPWAFAGVGLALWVGEIVTDAQFKEIIAMVVFACIALMLWKDLKKKNSAFPEKWWFAAFTGVAGGFATMIGNVAGPIFAIYLLAMHLPKNNYIGTQAWFFLIINISKFPLHLLVWKTIDRHTLTLDLMTLPAIALGAVAGIWLVKTIPEKTYRRTIMGITVLSAFLLLV